MTKLYPIRLAPAYQTYVWGGERIRSYFQREIAPGRYAESWEVSDRKEGMSLVANGAFKGKTFSEVLQMAGEAALGKHKNFEKFPLLLKIIDANETLSLQVHPNEEMAQKLGSEAKSEMWIALEESRVYAGLKTGVSKKQFLQAVEEDLLEPLLNPILLNKGDAIYIPAGQIHAIGSGSLLLEVQQNSNTTYRVYDWGRKGRELHLKEAMACIHFEAPQPDKLQFVPLQSDEKHQLDCLIANNHFIVERLEVKERLEMKRAKESFQILFCVSGTTLIDDEPTAPGNCFFIPAGVERVSIHGSCQMISVRLP